MTGNRAGSDGGRVRAAIRVIGATLLISALGATVAPGTASAATVTSKDNTVTPTLSCYTVSGSTTKLVLGYVNTKSKAVNYSVGGTSNLWSPSTYDGSQPGSYDVGSYDAVYAVTVASSDLSSVTWKLGSTTLDLGAAVADGTTCGSGTSLPAEGNGTGLAIGLLAAGAMGGLMVRRARRATA